MKRMKLNVPDDLMVDIRDGMLTLNSGDKQVMLTLGARHGVFGRGPVSWRMLQLAYLMPALAQFEPQPNPQDP